MEPQPDQNPLENAEAQPQAQACADSLVNKLYPDLKNAVASGNINAATFATLVPEAMQMAEAVADLSGSEKKQLVIDLLVKVAAELPLSETERSLLDGFIQNQLPHVIDIVVNSSLGKYAINLVAEAEEEVRGCFGPCSSIFKKRSAKSQ